MLRVLFLLAAATGCGDNIDAAGQSHGLEDRLTEWLTANGAVHGTVYRCESGAMCDGDEEWCWSGDEPDLEALLGGDCWPIGPDERFWPWFAGCAYACPLTVPGCNSHCGCACEASS